MFKFFVVNSKKDNKLFKLELVHMFWLKKLLIIHYFLFLQHVKEYIGVVFDSLARINWPAYQPATHLS